jgi:hypothetical protein
MRSIAYLAAGRGPEFFSRRDSHPLGIEYAPASEVRNHGIQKGVRLAIPASLGGAFGRKFRGADELAVHFENIYRAAWAARAQGTSEAGDAEIPECLDRLVARNSCLRGGNHGKRIGIQKRRPSELPTGEEQGGAARSRFL